MTLRVRPLECGWWEGDAGGMVTGQTGRMRMPVAAFVVEHPRGTLVFDTGMPIPGVLLYEGALVDSMKFAFGPMQVDVGGAGSGGSVKARLATGVSLGIGGLSVGGSIAVVMPPTPQMSGLHDGIIGASLFNGLIVSVDHDHGVMTLTRREAFTPPKGAAEVPLEVVGLLYTDVTDLGPLAGAPVRELWLTHCDKMKDLRPLLECRQLAKLSVPLSCEDVECLRGMPSLSEVEFDAKGGTYIRQTADEFWRQADARAKPRE